LEVFDLLFLCSDSFQIHELCLQQVQDWLGWLWLPHFIQNLQQQKQALNLQEKFKLIQILQNQRQVSQTNTQLLCLIRHHRTVIHKDRIQLTFHRRLLKARWLELWHKLLGKLLKVCEELVGRLAFRLVVTCQKQILLYQAEALCVTCLFEVFYLLALMVEDLLAGFEVLLRVSGEGSFA